MARPNSKEYELTATVMKLDREIAEKTASYDSMRKERDKYLRYANRLETLLTKYDPDWMIAFKNED